MQWASLLVPIITSILGFFYQKWTEKSDAKAVEEVKTKANNLEQENARLRDNIEKQRQAEATRNEVNRGDFSDAVNKL